MRTPRVLVLFMGDADGTIERSDLILDELAKLGLVLARDLQQRALAAEDNDEAARLAMAFHHVSRSVRQSLALTEKLQRDRRRAVRDDIDHTERHTASRRDARKTHVRTIVSRLIWTEAERPDTALRLCVDLDRHLDAEALDDAFLQGPVRRHVHRLCERLGLKPPAADEPDAPERSSA
jgi:hypothetical protein